MLQRTILGLALTTLVAPAQTITLAEGTATSLRIVTLPESNPNAADTVVLQDAELLPIELTGRTLAQEFDTSGSRRLERNGITRIELPDGGRLFRYQRVGGQFWGFLHIAPDGAARVVLELPGIGAQLEDPFVDRIGVAADGRHATIARASGGMYVVRLDGGIFASTGRADRLAVPGNVNVLPLSVMVGASTFFFQSDANGGNSVLWRCGLADGDVPTNVSPPAAAGARFKDQMALSRDGSRLVCLYGPQNQQQLWQVGVTGPATLLPPPPSKYEEPGYLPESPGEPAMLLNEAGTRLFYIDSIVRDELFLLDLQASLPSLAITEDTIFQPYIGVHILPKFTADALTIAVGDIGAMDWFQVALAPQGGAVTNLTGTGSLQQPFPAGTLNPVQAAVEGGLLLVSEQQGNGLQLRRLNLASGATTILQQGLLAAPQPGSATVGVADILVQGSAGDSLYAGLTGTPVVTLPLGVTFTPPVHGPLFAATWVHLANDLGMAAFYLPNGGLAVGGLEFDLRQIVATPIGGAVLVGTSVRYLAPGVFVVMNRPAATTRLCLSGAGG